MPPPREDEFDFVPDSAPQAAPAAEPLGFAPDPDAGTDAIPANHRETGRRMLVLPEVTFEVDVDRPSRTRTIEAPGQATEYREVEKAVSKEGGGPDVRPLMTRLGAWALDDEPASQAFEPELRGAAETMDAFGRGAREGAYFGFGDELGAGASSSGLGGQPELSSPAFGGAAMGRALLSRFVDDDPRYETEVSRERAADAAAQERSPYAYAAGSIAGSSPTLAIPGSAPTALGRIGLAGLTGAGLGAIRGVGESEAETVIDAIDRPSLARDALEGAAVEGLVSAGTAGAFEAASPVLQRLSKWATEHADDASREAVQSRLEGSGVWGARARRALREFPGGEEAFAADLRRLGIGHGVGHPARVARAEATGEAVERTALPRPTRAEDDALQVMTEAGERMDQVVQRMEDAASQRNRFLLANDDEMARYGMVNLNRVADEVEALAREYDSMPAGGDNVADQLRRLFVDPMQQWGSMSFARAHRLRQMIDGQINQWRQFPNMADLSGRLQTARRLLTRAMDDAARSIDPELYQQWRAANRDYSVAAFADQYGRGASRLSVGGGMGGAVGTGVELAMGGTPLTSIPASIATREVAQQQRMLWPGLRAVGLEALAPRLRALGARGERWAQMLERARQQSPRSASAVHWMLLQTDPEYRAAVAQAQGQEGQENSQ